MTMWEDQPKKSWKEESSSVGDWLIGVRVREGENLEITASFKDGDL